VREPPGRSGVGPARCCWERGRRRAAPVPSALGSGHLPGGRRAPSRGATGTFPGGGGGRGPVWSREALRCFAVVGLVACALHCAWGEAGCSLGSENHRLEKTSKIIESNHPPNTTIPTKPYLGVPHRHVFQTPLGMGTPPPPWAACSSA